MSRSKWNIAAWGLAAALLLVASQALAEDAFYSVAINDLKLSEGELPTSQSSQRVNWMGSWVNMRAVVDGDGEAYVRSLDANSPTVYPGEGPEQLGLAIRIAPQRKITGTLFWPKPDWSGSVKLRFVVEATPSDKAKTEFISAKDAYCRESLSRGLAGGAWFRHQLRELQGGAGGLAERTARDEANSASAGTIDQTFDLFSGRQAISENLQLDRGLQRAAGGEEMVPLASLKGISVAEIDWKPLIKDMQPAADPLAKLVPADQHLVLFPNFTALAAVGDRLATQGSVILGLAQPRTNDRQLLARYERQLGLSLADIGKILASPAAGSVALTGSDPYFAAGTDVALVFETADAEALKDKFWAAITAKADKSSQKIEEKSGSVKYRGLRSPDRRVSSYLAALPGAVVLANSPYQIEQLAAVAAGRAPAIASLDEFTFFRNRYSGGDQGESALVIISDATIRRWCSPQWRIASSRLTRDAAVLAELQAANMDKLIKKQAGAGPLQTDLPLAQGGKLTLSADGVQSSVLGNLDFMTPIAELKLDNVTKAEAEAYERWRDTYQTNWRWAFDPIALRLGVSDNRLTADLTVLPLIVGSDYRIVESISKGAAIAADAGDRHDALAQLILAINADSEMVRSGSSLLSQFTPGAKLDPLSWFGQSISVYIDDDPYWQEVAKLKTEAERQAFLEKNAGRALGLWFDVSSGFKLTLFLAAARAYIEQTAPGMTSWESLEYRGQPYVKITPTSRALPRGENGKAMDAHLFYVASGSFLLLTPSEAVLKRALDRQAAPAKDSPTEEAKPPWLGTSLALQVDHRLLPLLTNLGGGFFRQWMQARAWNNLAILNEWHRLYPDQDPLAVHARVWHEQLVCPGGGKYVWNDAWQTMESTVYGHPGEPKPGPQAPPELLNFRFANFGLTFEDQGLRARMTLDRKSPAGKTVQAKP